MCVRESPVHPCFDPPGFFVLGIMKIIVDLPGLGVSGHVIPRMCTASVVPPELSPHVRDDTYRAFTKYRASDILASAISGLPRYAA